MLKTTTKALCLITALYALSSNALAAKGAPWLTDMGEAQKTAQQQGKDIFVLFTGSDWCSPCKKLDRQVLEKQAFLDYAQNHFVLVDLDFPLQQEQTEAQKTHNQQWKKRYSITGYPKVFLTDAAANRYAKTGYSASYASNPAQYIEHLQKLKADRVEREKILAKAAKATGLERARLLDQALSHKRGYIENQDELYGEIIALSSADDEMNYKYVHIRGNQQLKKDIRAKIKRRNPPEENLKVMLALLDQYSYLKEGKALEDLIKHLTRAYAGADQKDTALSLLDTMIADNSYSSGFRQSLGELKKARQ